MIGSGLVGKGGYPQTVTSPMPTDVEGEGRWRVTWTSGSAVKRVDITDAATGRRAVGRDWASWDIAYRQALFQLIIADQPPRSARRR